MSFRNKPRCRSNSSPAKLDTAGITSEDVNAINNGPSTGTGQHQTSLNNLINLYLLVNNNDAVQQARPRSASLAGMFKVPRGTRGTSLWACGREAFFSPLPPSPFPLSRFPFLLSRSPFSLKLGCLDARMIEC